MRSSVAHSSNAVRAASVASGRPTETSRPEATTGVVYNGSALRRIAAKIEKVRPGMCLKNKDRKKRSPEKNKDVIFSQNEPEKLFRINTTPQKSAKTNRKIA
jgi:hypothetical protein